MLELTKLNEELEQEAEGRKKLASYDYFTIVWYYKERKDLFKNKEIYNLGYWQESPIHEKKNEKYYKKGVWTPTKEGIKKPHKHLICKASNKQTANAFIKKLLEVLNNDIKGIAINKEDAGIKDIAKMLRYQIHLNNPYKEQFNWQDFITNCPQYFWTEYAKAFQFEIQNQVFNEIIQNELITFAEVTKNTIQDLVFQAWLQNNKNMQYVFNLLNDNRRTNSTRR